MVFPLFLGSLSILKALDREEQDVFNLTIVAEDHGIPQLSTSQVLSVRVIDVNDEAPVFQRAEFEALVTENKGPGTTVLKVTAVDRDQGGFKCVDKRVKDADKYVQECHLYACFREASHIFFLGCLGQCRLEWPCDIWRCHRRRLCY